MQSLRLFLACVSWSLAVDAAAATAIHRCEAGGKVSFQNFPCASAEPRQQPSLQELNARQREVDAAAKAARPSRPASPPSAALPSAGVAASEPPASGAAARFSCDGRKYCQQMRSCAEAKFFLANCPDTRMDGDRDGIPCEEQWCR